MYARAALLALALLAATDAVPRRVKQVKHGKLQPSRHRADPTATPPELHSTRVGTSNGRHPTRVQGARLPT